MNPLTIITIIEAAFSCLAGVAYELKNSGLLPESSPVHPAVAQMQQALADAKTEAAKTVAPNP